jgi:glyoxylase-like metal-dependent hydrolase (beta-lactamase superfamily II)
VFFSAAARLAVVGDVLFAGSIGRTDFPRGNHAALVNSIRHKLWPLGKDVSLFPATGRCRISARNVKAIPMWGLRMTPGNSGRMGGRELACLISRKR